MSVIPASKERRSLQGKLARAKASANGYRPLSSDVDVTEIRREIHAQTLADAIKALADTFPPLTAEQRERLSALLRGSTREQPAYDVLDSVPSAAEGVKEKPGTHAATRPE